MSRYIIGIDPGFSGALAVYDREARGFCGLFDMPTYRAAERNELDVDGLRDIVRPFAHDAIACVEDVHPRKHAKNPDGTERKEGVVSAFRFGEQKGVLRGLLAGMGVAVHWAAPSAWKQSAGVTKDKSTSLALARKRHPAMAYRLTRQKDDGRAEAILLADLMQAALAPYQQNVATVLS